MPFEFLSDFLSALQDAGELTRIMAPVDGGLELAAITDRVCKSPDGGKALFFGNVKNSTIPVVTNLLGSRKRVQMALGLDSLGQLTQKMNRSLQPETGGWLESLRLAPSSAGLSKFQPRIIKTAVCQQVVKLGRDVNLWDLPIPRCWPEESNPVITSGIVTARDLETAEFSVARFPVQVIGQTRLVPHWNRYHTGYQQWQRAVRLQKQLPISISLGGDPINLLAAGTPLAASDGFGLAGLMRSASVDLVRARSMDLDIPASSEISIEGYIDYAAPLVDAPGIANSTGLYLPAEPLPEIEVTAITHRANPVFPAVVPGPPPCEESWMELVHERLHLAVIQSTVPEIVEIHQPFSGAGRSLMFVSINKQHPGQARQVLHALWGSRVFGQRKMIVIVDGDVDVTSEHDVWLAVGSFADFGRDFVNCEGPTSMDDQTTGTRGLGCKLGIDATRKLPEETQGRLTAGRLLMPDELIARLKDRWGELGLPV